MLNEMSCRSTRFRKVMCIRGEGVFRFCWQAKSRLTSWGASISATCRVSVYKFIHTLIRGVAMFHLCWLVHSFGSDWNISTPIAWVVMKFGTLLPTEWIPLTFMTPELFLYPYHQDKIGEILPVLYTQATRCRDGERGRERCAQLQK